MRRSTVLSLPVQQGFPDWNCLARLAETNLKNRGKNSDWCKFLHFFVIIIFQAALYGTAPFGRKTVGRTTVGLLGCKTEKKLVSWPVYLIHAIDENGGIQTIDRDIMSQVFYHRCTASVDKKCVGQMSLDHKSVSEVSVKHMSVNYMSVSWKFVDQNSFDQMSRPWVFQLSICKPNVFKINVCWT